MSTYHFKKMNITKNDVSWIELRFDNGDTVPLVHGEIYNLSISLCDKLIVKENTFTPVAADGYIKLKLSNKQRILNAYSDVKKYEEYLKDRRRYLTHRLVRSNDLCKISLFNSDNWSIDIDCRATAHEDGECVIVQFISQPIFGESGGAELIIELKDPDIKDIDRIDLDFENCEHYRVYRDEIVEFAPRYAPTLAWCGRALCREVIGGYMIVKLCRDSRIHDLYLTAKREATNKDFIRRLCGRKGESECDLANLCLHYAYPRCGVSSEEVLSVASVDYEETEAVTLFKGDRNTPYEDENDEDDFDNFVSGYCKKRKDGSVIIAFGKEATETIERHL